MPTLKISKGSVIKWQNTIDKWHAQEDIHLGLNPNIPYLEKRIAFVVRSVRTAANEISKKYFQMDDNGKVKYEGEPGKETPVMNGELKKEDYDTELRAMLSQPVEIKL
jgi:hypothetical protein